MPAPKRNVSLFLFDKNTENEKAIMQNLLKIHAMKQLEESKDFTFTQFINTNTDESLDSFKVSSDDFIHYNTLLTWEALNKQEDILKVNWLQAIYIGIELLLELFDGMNGIITKQIVLLSDISKPRPENWEDLLEKCIDYAKENDVYVYIFGVNIVPESKLIASIEDVDNWQKNLKVSEDDSLENVCRLVREVPHAVACTNQLGFHLFFSYIKHKGRQPWQVPLSVGTNLDIPCQTVRVYKNEPPFKLIKLKDDEDHEGPSFKLVLAKDVTQEVLFGKAYRGIEMHGKFVKITDEKKFKVYGSRTFSLVQFTDLINIPEFYLTGDGSQYVLPEKTPVGDSVTIFFTLLECLAERKKCAIAKYVYAKDNNPKYVVLIPKLEEKCFIYCQLSYGCDIQRTLHVTPCNEAQKVEQNNDIIKYLNKLENYNDLRFHLTPNMMHNSESVNIANLAMDKYLGDNFDLQELDINYMEQNIHLDELKSFWPERSKQEQQDEAKEDEDYFS